jgi:hypothetical protein
MLRCIPLAYHPQGSGYDPQIREDPGEEAFPYT